MNQLVQALSDKAAELRQMPSQDLFGRKLPLPLIDRSAPFWKGDTAEALLEKRRLDRQADEAEKAAKRRRKRSLSSSPSRTPPEGPDALRKKLRRLERNLPRRKTLAARLRNEQEIAQLRKELGVE